MRKLRCTVLMAALSLSCAVAANEGDLDPGFNATGLVRTAFDEPSGNKTDHPFGLVLQGDGKLLLMGSVDIGGSDVIGLARLKTNGLLDPTFNGDGNNDGKVTFGAIGSLAPRGVALLSDGRIVVAAQLSSTAVLLRRASNGAADDLPGAAFGVLGFAIPGATATEFSALLGVAGGKFLAVGTVTTVAGGADFFAARFSMDGVLDSSFGSQLGYTRIGFDLDNTRSDRAVALALASDGRIAVVGTVSNFDNEFGIAMLQSNGQLDLGFDGDGKSVVDFDIGLVSNDRASGVCFAPNGSVLVAGNAVDGGGLNLASMALWSTGGSLVNGFGSNGRRQYALFNDTQTAAASCQADGRFLLLGTVLTSQASLGPSEAFVARFLSNGSNDNSYGNGGLTIFGLNRSGASPAGRADLGVALTQRSDHAVYAAFDAEFDAPDYDFGLARLRGDTLFADGFD